VNGERSHPMKKRSLLKKLLIDGLIVIFDKSLYFFQIF
jgi:hypothetical protein